MKVSDLDSFPWPVLRNNTDDYDHGDFSVTIEASENMKNGALSIRYKVNVGEDYIAEKILERTAEMAFCITCLETFYNRIHRVRFENANIEIEKGELSGVVKILPVIVLLNDVDDYYTSNFNQEFGIEPFRLEKGSLLAIGDVYQINVGREKMAPIESIFGLSRLDSGFS